MAIRPRIKDDWKGKGLFRTIAEALNRLAQWCNDFDAEEPITVETKGWGVTLKWDPWQSPFWHPWKIKTSETDGKLDITGGLVYAGGAPNVVAALDDETPSDGWKCYLRVKHYYATGTASEYALGSTTDAWPANTWSSTAYETHIRIGEISGSTLYQYIYEDQIVPRIPPPLPGTVNNYALLAVAGTMQWVQTSACP